MKLPLFLFIFFFIIILLSFSGLFLNSNIFNLPIFKNEANCPGLQTINQLWQQKDAKLYQKDWPKSSMVERLLVAKPYQPSAKFVQLQNSLKKYLPQITEKELGPEYMAYAGITAGDINHDGYLDLVLSKINQKIGMFINNHNNDFVDVTACIFAGEIPKDVEHVFLTDFNNDTYLDLLIIYSQYKGPKRNTIYFFDPEKKLFYDSKQSFAKDKKMSGGIGIYDINRDKKLDFYVSFGLDWLSQNPDYMSHAYKDEFWVSEGNTWQEKLKEYFPIEVSANSYAGMTALFTDFNRDGLVDFLLGNDFDDPSITLVGRPNDSFSLIDKNKIESNSKNSMSYFPVDFDNDGIFELWENGISWLPAKEKKDEVASQNINNIKSNTLENEYAVMNKQYIQFLRDKALGNIECNTYSHPFVKSYCRDIRITVEAVQKNDMKLCNQIINNGKKARCIREVKDPGFPDAPHPSDTRFNPGKFPPKIKENSLLKYDNKKDKYFKIKVNNEVAYTSWTWAGYPFDVNNDGFIDLFITNGATINSHDVKRLLINNSDKNHIDFTNLAKEYNVDLEDETRGVLIADFDNDGDGDLVVNNYLTEPKYFQNNIGGSSIIVELRSKNSNYYAVGAQLELHTNKGIQLREIHQGGIWNSGQPYAAHFGLAQDEKINYLIIRWPDRHTQKLDNISINKKYIFYE